MATQVGPIAIRRTPTRGDGPHEPAILVHGLAGNAMNWVDLAACLADRLDCVSMDLPGHGATPHPADGDYSIAAHTRAVVALAEAVFGGQQFHLFGHSMGGTISVQVARCVSPIRCALRRRRDGPLVIDPTLSVGPRRHLARRSQTPSGAR